MVACGLCGFLVCVYVEEVVFVCGVDVEPNLISLRLPFHFDFVYVTLASVVQIVAGNSHPMNHNMIVVVMVMGCVISRCHLVVAALPFRCILRPCNADHLRHRSHRHLRLRHRCRCRPRCYRRHQDMWGAPIHCRLPADADATIKLSSLSPLMQQSHRHRRRRQDVRRSNPLPTRC